MNIEDIALQPRRALKGPRWERLRKFVFNRDNFRCRMCRCFVTKGRSGQTAAVADHIQSRNRAPHLAWNADNIQTLCKRCHDSTKQSEERNGYSDQIGPDGFPVDPRHPFNRGPER